MKSQCIGSVLFIAVFFIALSSCVKDPVIREELPSNDINLVVPQGWPSPNTNFSSNPFTRDGFILGRKLFYETKLSLDNSISCGSCHQQFAGFAHKGKAISPGVNGSTGIRNSPVLFNLNWHPAFMWDGSIDHIEAQPVFPITSPNEMGGNMEQVLLKLQKDPHYKHLFQKAFGTENISEILLSKALSQFMGMLVSHNSKYDLYMNGQASLTTGEINGLALFQQKCASCHQAPLFTNFQYRNNGLDSVFIDGGRGTVTMQSSDSGTFKVPSLRNIELSLPYMHDGRFETLEEVLNHYSNGIKNSSTLAPALIGGIPLTAAEKQDIIAFLKTLTDDKFTHDTRFNDPFNN